jgi:hypothetical protein
LSSEAIELYFSSHITGLILDKKSLAVACFFSKSCLSFSTNKSISHPVTHPAAIAELLLALLLASSSLNIALEVSCASFTCLDISFSLSGIRFCINANGLNDD